MWWGAHKPSHSLLGDSPNLFKFEDDLVPVCDKFQNLGATKINPSGMVELGTQPKIDGRKLQASTVIAMMTTTTVTLTIHKILTGMLRIVMFSVSHIRLCKIEGSIKTSSYRFRADHSKSSLILDSPPNFFSKS